MRHIDGTGLTILSSTNPLTWKEKPRLTFLWLKIPAFFDEIAKLRSLTLEGAIFLRL